MTTIPAKSTPPFRFAQNDFKVLNKETCYTGFCNIERFHLTHALFHGGNSEPIVRELCVRRAAVGVLPYDPYNNTVVLIEQFRIGALTAQTPWLLEIIAGISDKPNESVEAVAHREAKEEAGLDLIELLPISQYWVSPGACNEYMNLFCAKVDSRDCSGIYGARDEAEDIFVHVFTLEQAFSALDNGQINNGSSIIALQWLRLNHAELKQKWQK